jgi:hypothetical protein
MIPGVLIVIGLAVGYTVTVGMAIVTTFAITAADPTFVVREYRIRQRYKLVQELLWLACAVAGGYATATVTGTMYPWLTASLLAAILILVLWTNTWEMRQRGLANQLLMSAMSVAGVALGFLLRMPQPPSPPRG